MYFGFTTEDPDNGYIIGAPYTYNYIVPAKTSYTVTLNTNGGSGGATSLTKWHGEPLDLTTGFTEPTRVGYRFEGWALTSGGAKVDEYTTDAATTLYAVWTPIITGVSITVHTLRVANGTSTSESDDGEYCYGTVAYTVTGGAKGTLNLSVAADDSTVVFDSGKTASISKAAGTTLTGTHVFRAHNCDTDTKITFTVTASATNTSVSGEAPVTASQSDVLSVAYFPLDILGDNYVSQGQRPGHGLAIGLPAKKEGFAVGMDIFFQQWAGIIQMFAGSTPPAGWLLCDGSYVSKAEYPTLFDTIGYTWGAEDSVPTGYFALPDFRGRTPLGETDGQWLDETSPNLIIDGYRLKYSTDSYLSYQLPLLESMTVNTQYTIQLWDVTVVHTGKTAATVGVDVYWGGGSVKLAEWLGEDYFTPVANHAHTTTTEYYAPYLELVFTTGSTAGASPGELYIYNSVPDASGSRYLRIGKFQLKKGSHSKAPFEPRPQYRNRMLGTTGGEGAVKPSTDTQASHTHAKGTLAITASGSHDHKVKGYGKTLGSGSYGYRYGSAGSETVDIGMTNTTHTHPNANFSGNTASTGGGIAPDNMPPYAVVNFIIHTGKVN